MARAACRPSSRPAPRARPGICAPKGTPSPAPGRWRARRPVLSADKAIATSTCPGCGLEMPTGSRTYNRKFNASAECWSVFEDVLAKEFQSAFLFGQVHQLTVDAYAVQ